MKDTDTHTNRQDIVNEGEAQTEGKELSQRAEPALLVSVKRREQAIRDACSGGVQYVSLFSSLQKAIARDPDILQCSPASVLDALLASAKLGIDPSGEHNSGWFIRYKRELKLMLGYGGLIELITRAGKYAQVDAEVVYKGEPFEAHRGTRNEIIHEVDLKARDAPGNMIVACYAIARGEGGLCQWVVLNHQDINRARSASKNGKLWDQHYPEMVKKTAVRNLAKWMVLDRLGQHATAISDDGDGQDSFDRREDQRDLGSLEDRMRRDMGDIRLVEDEDAPNNRPGDPEQDPATGEAVPPPSGDGERFAEDLINQETQQEGRKL